jgi:V8-like Glu-specific endopeptidase
MRRRPNITILLVPGLLLALLAPSIPAAAAAGATGATARLRVHQPAAEVEAYWTKSRMRAAEPVPTVLPGGPQAASARAADAASPSYVPPAAPGSEGDAQLMRGEAAATTTTSRAASPVLDPTAPKIRAHGKVFFTVVGGTDPGNFVCSGTAVNSRNKSVVLTAGHCVYDVDTGGGKSKNFVFVPAYQAGAAPYGTWPAKSLATTRRWKRKGNLRYDVAAAVVKRDDAGQRLQSVVGARGIGFDQPRDQTYEVIGYPQLTPFDGTLEYECVGPYGGSDSAGSKGPAPMKVDCDMTPGASGGGWIAGGKTLVSVTSYSYGTEYDPDGQLYGPYFSTTAKKLYKSVRGGKKRKHHHRHKH